ncbi:trypsin-like peptidase domain-containing protein [Algibacillus agarilyticus]|uniref:trypsin-like peptidase domain-containing protein n=1 Tax=Algibacillus agarilyticus TaxID=2234133 RepID=UPI001E48EF02|nr:trypsin-like peptidase domain-containing protein [Algibacillus agarilyticus]
MFIVLAFTFFPDLKSNNRLWHAVIKQSTPSNDPISFAVAVKRSAPAVVNIYTRGFQPGGRLLNNTTREVQRLGSGVIASNKGFILTAEHVVKDAELIMVALQDGRYFEAQLIGTDPANDLAVLYVEANNLPVIPINKTRLIQAGDVVLAIGNPYNLGQTITQGIISATGRSGLTSNKAINLDYSDFIQMDAAINDGNSGGALVNSLGELVGVNSAKLATRLRQNTQGIFFAVNAHSALKIMDRIIADGRVVRSYLGIAGSDHVLPTELKKIDNAIAIEVSSVAPGSPAELAGIRRGDLIFEIANNPITHPSDVLEWLEHSKPGTEVKVLLVRQNIILEKTVTLAEVPQA